MSGLCGVVFVSLCCIVWCGMYGLIWYICGVAYVWFGDV